MVWNLKITHLIAFYITAPQDPVSVQRFDAVAKCLPNGAQLLTAEIGRTVETVFSRWLHGHLTCQFWVKTTRFSPWAKRGSPCPPPPPPTPPPLPLPTPQPTPHPQTQPTPPHPWSSVSGTILFRGLSGIISMFPEKKWDSLLNSGIFQNGRRKIWDFQYLGNYFM